MRTLEWIRSTGVLLVPAGLLVARLQLRTATNFDQKKAFPFGCLVDYLLHLDWSKKNLVKMDCPSIPGVFLGYILEPGCDFKESKGTYICAPLSDFIQGWNKPSIHNTQVLFADLNEDKSFKFPLKKELID